MFNSLKHIDFCENYVYFNQMNCPHCGQPVPATALTCAECGFQSATLCSRLGDHWVRLDRLTDAAHCLRLGDRRKLEVKLDDFERRFPQVFFAVYFGVLPQGVKVSEAGFWLLNHAAFGTHDIAKRNEFGVILVIDPAVGHACFTLGYALEALAERIGFSAVLDRLKPSLARSEYGEAVSIAIDQIDRTMRSAGKAQAPNWRSSLAHALGYDLGLTPLRPSRRPAGAQEHAGHATAS